MRVTGKVGNAHWARVFVKCPSVYLNGVEQNGDYIAEADDIAGYVINYLPNGLDGFPLVDNRGYFVTDKLYGIVEIFGQRRE